MINFPLIFFGKVLSALSKQANIGHGSTWPGHIALRVNKSIINELIEKNNIKIILIAGTNGKTTTSKMLKSILEKAGFRVLHNASGANLLNGIASALLLHASTTGKLPYDYAIFEIDENIFPVVVKHLIPAYVMLMNIFRDQLDRYGEVRSIADKWKSAMETLPRSTKFILNADDPMIAWLGSGAKNDISYFGVADSQKKEMEHAADTIYCPNCNTKLTFTSVVFSHLGVWECSKCFLKRPKPTIQSYSFYPLPGSYNRYNVHAAVLTARMIGVNEASIKLGLEGFEPAFGRYETITYRDKKIKILLSKNPTGFNASLRAVQEEKAKYILFALNDQIADGTDVSWIWDVDFEEFLPGFTEVFVSGNRAFDMGLRLKYAIEQMTRLDSAERANGIHSASHSTLRDEPSGSDSKSSESPKWQIEESVNKTVSAAIEMLPKNETLYILPTYTAMLEVRKILTGKHIL
ncbi:MAG: DUF1727 domain-containing protein [Candidatus Levybacteria bacterium]|nr:DUF1727 domain-containing protein [Candidatus Levybacteria bacterium]